jgi:hypothetical protein
MPVYICLITMKCAAARNADSYQVGSGQFLSKVRVLGYTT